jgi:hypothetical protein
VRESRDTHLERDSRKASQNFAHVQYLLRDRFSIAYQQRARGSSQSVKLRPSRRWPATFFADLRERVSISWVEVVCSVLRGVSEKADRVEADDELLGGMTGAAPSFAVKVDQRTNRLGSPPIMATINGSPSVPARTNDSGVPPTPTQMGNGFWSGRG